MFLSYQENMLQSNPLSTTLNIPVQDSFKIIVRERAIAFHKQLLLFPE